MFDDEFGEAEKRTHPMIGRKDAFTKELERTKDVNKGANFPSQDRRLNSKESSEGPPDELSSEFDSESSSELLFQIVRHILIPLVYNPFSFMISFRHVFSAVNLVKNPSINTIVATVAQTRSNKTQPRYGIIVIYLSFCVCVIAIDIIPKLLDKDNANFRPTPSIPASILSLSLALSV